MKKRILVLALLLWGCTKEVPVQTPPEPQKEPPNLASYPYVVAIVPTDDAGMEYDVLVNGNVKNVGRDEQWVAPVGILDPFDSNKPSFSAEGQIGTLDPASNHTTFLEVRQSIKPGERLHFFVKVHLVWDGVTPYNVMIAWKDKGLKKTEPQLEMSPLR